MLRSLVNEQDNHFLLVYSLTDVITVKHGEFLQISSYKIWSVNAGKQILGTEMMGSSPK